MCRENKTIFFSLENDLACTDKKTIFAISMGLTILYPRFGIIFLLVALLVGLSRIILIAHYPSDVVFGAYLGLSTAILLKRYYLDKQ